MPTWLPSLFKLLLTLAGLVAVPVATFLAGHPVIYSVLEFVATLLALLVKSPLAKSEPKA